MTHPVQPGPPAGSVPPPDMTPRLPPGAMVAPPDPRLPSTGGPKKTSGMAIASLVLACIFFIPLLPLIGAILGIVAVIRLRPDQGGKGLAIAAIPIGLVFFLFTGILAAVAIPSFIKYTRKAKTLEARMSLQKMRAGARSFATADRYDRTGALIPAGFPVGNTDWTPKTPCCEQASKPKCSPNAADWNQPTFKALQFQMSDRHYFQYRIRSTGRVIIVEARGDLDCDGTYSSRRLIGTMGSEGPTFRGPIVRRRYE